MKTGKWFISTLIIISACFICGVIQTGDSVEAYAKSQHNTEQPMKPNSTEKQQSGKAKAEEKLSSEKDIEEKLQSGKAKVEEKLPSEKDIEEKLQSGKAKAEEKLPSKEDTKEKLPSKEDKEAQDKETQPEGTPLGMAAMQEVSPEKGYHYIYIGQNDGEPLVWRVLSHQTNMGTDDGIFVLTNQGLVFSDFGETNVWADSNVRKWCQEFYASKEHFTDDERALIMETTKEETEFSDYEYLDGSKYLHCGLTQDHLFALSVEEAMNAKYGFPDTIMTDGTREMQYLGRLCWWWLRSPCSKGDHISCMCYRDGNITNDKSTRSRIAIRPAMNLTSDIKQVLMAVPTEKYQNPKGEQRDKAASAKKEAYYWKLKAVNKAMKNPAMSSVKTQEGKLTIALDSKRTKYQIGQKPVLMITDSAYKTVYDYIPYDGEWNEKSTVLEWTLPFYYHENEYALFLLMEHSGGAQETDCVSQPEPII